MELEKDNITQNIVNKLDEKENKRLAYNEYMRVWRLNHLDKYREKGRTNYYNSKKRKELDALSGKALDYSKYTKDDFDNILKYINLLNEIKEKYPELI